MERSPPAPRPPSPLEDPGRWREVVESVGIDSMLVVIHDRMGQRLRGTCSAEDIWLEALAHAWRDRAQHRWDGIRRFRAWLLAIANHRIQDEVDKLRAAKRAGDTVVKRFSELRPDGGRISSHLPGISTTPEQLAYYRERAEIIRKTLATLPADLEPFVRRHLLEDEPIEAIGKSLGVARETAYRRFRKGAQLYAHKLAELLTESGLDQRRP